MPQLDLVSFFPQIFWSFIMFFLFFLKMSFSVIPKVATVLKYRKKKLVILAQEINAKKDGSSRLLFEYDQRLKISFIEINLLLKKVRGFGNAWVSSTIYILNTTSFKELNQRFLNTAFFKEFIK